MYGASFDFLKWKCQQDLSPAMWFTGCHALRCAGFYFKPFLLFSSVDAEGGSVEFSLTFQWKGGRLELSLQRLPKTCRFFYQVDEQHFVIIEEIDV